MKGLALDVVWGLIIAIASVLVFLFLVTGFFREAANWLYCNVYIRIENFFSGTSATIPEVCKSFPTQSKVEEIKDTNNKVFSRKLLAYIIACWKDAEIKEFYESHPCYELRLLGKVENVSEENVTSILITEDHCKSIENVDYGCGTENQILWSVDGSVDKSLTEKDISDAINNRIIPLLSIDESMIPSVSGIERKIQLKNFLANEVPEKICSFLGCTWVYDQSKDEVVLTIDSNEYKYSIDLVLSFLEAKGLIKSVVENQKILLIEFNGPKNGVEVIG